MRIVTEDERLSTWPLANVNDPADIGDATEIERTRRGNLRQLLTRSTRGLNERVVDALREYGYADVRLAHGALLVNLELAGNTVTEVADRAQMPKQAMSKLAAELEEMGFITREPHPQDGRAWRLTFTRKGRLLLKRTVAIVRDFEREAAAVVGQRRYVEMCEALHALEDFWSSTRGESRR